MTSMITPTHLAALCAAALPLLPSVEAAESSSGRPNIVLILADDLGWRDLGCYGSDFYPSPNIDRFAQQGIRFTDAYAACPVCSPTRASIISGLDPARLGFTQPTGSVEKVVLRPFTAKAAKPWDHAFTVQSITRLDTAYETLAEVLKKSGYATGHFGKWHLGPPPYSPLEQGFDVDVPHFSGPGPAGSYLAPWAYPPDLKFVGQPGEHIEDRMAKEAAKFIFQNKDHPFFLNYWAFSVHTPLGAKPENVEHFKKLVDPAKLQRDPMMAAMVGHFDEAIGSLLQAIEDAGVADRTVVIFMSDNGGVMYGDYGDVPITNNAPLRDGKGTIFEGGTRVPLIVRWPGVVKPGSLSSALVSSVDLFPTILQIAGAGLPAGQPCDGISFLPLLEGTARTTREQYFCYYPINGPLTGSKATSSVREGKWKLIRYFSGNDDLSDRYELYDLDADLGESHDVAAAHPADVRRLSAALDQYLKSVGALIPPKNPAFDPAAVAPPPGLPNGKRPTG